MATMAPNNMLTSLHVKIYLDKMDRC